MCIITTVEFKQLLHSRIKGNRDKMRNFHNCLIEFLLRRNVMNVGGSIKQIHSSEIVNEEQIIDLEIWILLDKPIEGNEEFEYVEKIMLNDVLMVEHNASPKLSNETIKKMQIYMEKNELMPVEPAYNHSLHLVNGDVKDSDMHFKIYLKVKKCK